MRSGGELELRLRRGPRRRHRRQPYPLQIGPDRGRIGQGGDDPQAPATGRACAEVGGKHPRQQGRPPQAMGAGRSHFVLFYLKWTKEQLQTSGEDPFWQQRLESTIDRAEAESGGFLPYQAITILGLVRHGIIDHSADDPDCTNRRFHVDPTYPLDDVVLEEVTDHVLRAFLKGFVKVIYPYNIKQVQFVDELEHEESLFEQLEREIGGGK